MARKINRLNARAVASIMKLGRHADGGGLYLSISPNGGRRWVFLYRWHGKPTEIGFGSARDVTLARARELASQARTNLTEGINPKDARKASEGATFGECADRVIEAMRPSWRNGRHTAQWKMTLRDYAAPLRRLPVDKIVTDDVLAVLKTLWNAGAMLFERSRKAPQSRLADAGTSSRRKITLSVGPISAQISDANKEESPLSFFSSARARLWLKTDEGNTAF
jgi:hypothetical protein